MDVGPCPCLQTQRGPSLLELSTTELLSTMIHNESAASERSEGVDNWGATTFFCQGVNSGTHTIQNLFSSGGRLLPHISNIYIFLLFVWILWELLQFLILMDPNT